MALQRCSRRVLSGPRQIGYDLLGLLLLLSPSVGLAQSSSEFEYVVENGGAVLTGNSHVPGPVLTIPPTINGLPVTGIGQWDQRSDVSIVLIPDSVRFIGNFAFDHWNSLQTVVVGKAVGQIGGNAFGWCFNLRTAFFLGDAPEVPTDIESDLFGVGPSGGFWYPAFDPTTVYHLPGKHGWDSLQSGFDSFNRRPVKVWNGGPVFLRQPLSATVYSDVRLTAEAVAPSPDPLSYQWRRDGRDLPGQTNVTLSLKGLKAAETGDYQVVASHSSGVAVSDVARITLRVPVPGSYEAATLALGPKATWPLNETNGTTAAEFVSGANGTYIDANETPLLTPLLSRPGATANTGTSIDFHGTSWVYVDASSYPALDIGTGDFTVSAWIYATDFVACSMVSRGGDDWSQGWVLDLNASGAGSLRLRTSIGVTSGQGTVQTAPGVVTLNEWQQVVVSCHRDPGAKAGQDTTGNGWTRIYRNGRWVKSGDVGAGDLDAPRSPLEISAFRVESALVDEFGKTPFHGRMDEVALFGRALTEEQVAGLYAAGIGPQVLVSRSGAGLTLTWPQGILQASTTLGDGKAGPDWMNVPAATSPLAIETALGARFYRVRIP